MTSSLVSLLTSFGSLFFSLRLVSDMTTQHLNVMSLKDKFGDEHTCREYLEKLRWPSEVACPRCGDCSVSEITTRDQFDCNSCRYRFSVTSGTIFDNTKLPLRKRFVAMYLRIESKKGISANQMKRTLGLSYKTAWYLCHRIREAMGNDPLIGPTLFGIVEVDETLVGGKRRCGGTGHRVGNTWVAGAVQRDGRIRLESIPNIEKVTLHDFIKRTVKDEAEWVVGDVHTNSVEGVWSLFKRSIVGPFHHISAKHMDRYLKELEWRFNNRDNPFMFRDLLLRILDGEELRYDALTA